MLIEPPFDDWPRVLATVRQREMVSAGDEDEILGLTSQFPHPDGLFSRRDGVIGAMDEQDRRSEEHTSELQSLMRTSYAVFCLKKKRKHKTHGHSSNHNMK